jgi:CheY-like chemotaxis protein
MTIQAAAAPLAQRVSYAATVRGYTVGGTSAFAARALLEQVVSQTATNAGGRIPVVDTVLTWPTTLSAAVGGGPGYVLTIVLALLCPLGGPVWAGIVPLSVSSRGARAAASAIRRHTAGRVAIPGSRHVPARLACQPGFMRTSVLIVDDSPAFGDVAKRVLERGQDRLDVVAVATTIDQAMAYVASLRPHIVLADIHLGDESGFDLVDRVAAAVPHSPPVVLMSTHSESEFADLVEASAAKGFVPKVRLSAEAVLACVGDRPSS